jgi:hypothetical protein
MHKGETKYRRVLGRQVAVELPENGLAKVSARDDQPGIQSFTTCDGVRTHRADTGVDCSGQSDDIGGYPV